MTSKTLHGCRVLLTKPIEQSAELAEKLTTLGGVAHCLPCIRISPRPVTNSDFQLFQQAEIVLFTSPYAAMHSIPQLQKLGTLHLPTIAAVGPSTAATLLDLGLPCDLQPVEKYSAQALLAMPELACIAGRHIVICTGHESPSELAQILQDRGARVSQIECYQRNLPTYDRWHISQALQPMPKFTLITSITALINLETIVGQQMTGLMATTTLILSSQRIREIAQQRHGNAIIKLAASATNKDLLQAIRHCHTIP